MKLKSGLIFLLTLFFCVAPFLSSAAALPIAKADLSKIEKSVVKIFSSYRKPSYRQPWQYRPRKSAIGSGFIIGGNRIMTNAHVVTNSVFIQLKKSGDPKKYRAFVETVGHQCDLAILRVEDKKFFEGTEPLSFGKLPALLDRVSVFGYPLGGSVIAITQGVVSRNEVTLYAHSGFALLATQIDAAINPGNSGGPAINKGKVVGVAMQAIMGGDNIGYVIPTPVINHFLDDIKDGRYDGFPGDGVFTELAENESLRSYYKLTPAQTGVIVIKTVFGSSSEGKVQKGDLVTSVDDVDIANDGSVLLSGNARVVATYIVQKHQIGEKLKLGIIRKGKKLSVEFKLKKPQLLVKQLFDERPHYFIYGGLLFTRLTYNYLQEWGRNWRKNGPRNLVHLAEKGSVSKERNEVVVLRSVLPHKVNAGYHSLASKEVVAVNGTKIKTLAEFVGILKTSKADYNRIELESGQIVILGAKSVAESEKEIMKVYGIHQPASDDLL